MTSECFDLDGIPGINGGVDVLGRNARKKICKPEPNWNSGPQHQLTILRREADLSASDQANLFSHAAWNPHAQAVTPFLNLGLHAQ